MTEQVIPQAYVWRRLHSLTGIWLTLFIIQHLLLNSQAALFFGDDGEGFISGVNSIHNLPYLPVIELAILGFPILIHMIWGINYALTAKPNSYGNSGTTAYLPQYSRNHAYTWQRITSWILIFGLIGHIVHMRFIEYPTFAKVGSQEYYMTPVGLDRGIFTLAERLNVELYDENRNLLQAATIEIPQPESQIASLFSSMREIFSPPAYEATGPGKIKELIDAQKKEQDKAWIEAMEKRPLKKGEAIAVAKDFGTAELLMLRETFKMPIMIVLYTFFVLAACYHGFNGLWTSLIKWGITLTERSQKMFLRFSYGLMTIVSLLGLAAVWLTYWNLRN